MTVFESPLHGRVDIQALENGVWVTYIAAGITIRRGGSRDGLGIKTDVGLCTFTLRDRQDPLHGGTFTPGQPVRIQTSTRPLFTGRIVDIASAYPLDKQHARAAARVTVTVCDAVQIHTAPPRYGCQIAQGFESFESRINRLASSAQAPIDVPVVGSPRGVYAF